MFARVISISHLPVHAHARSSLTAVRMSTQFGDGDARYFQDSPLAATLQKDEWIAFTPDWNEPAMGFELRTMQQGKHVLSIELADVEQVFNILQAMLDKVPASRLRKDSDDTSPVSRPVVARYIVPISEDVYRILSDLRRVFGLKPGDGPLPDDLVMAHLPPVVRQLVSEYATVQGN